MKKKILITLFGAMLAASPVLAADLASLEQPDIVVHKRPPHTRSEHPPAPPNPGDVWISGYQSWDGHAYVWQPGHWEMPPHEHAIWMAPYWEHRNGGYVFVQGWWD